MASVYIPKFPEVLVFKYDGPDSLGPLKDFFSETGLEVPYVGFSDAGHAVVDFGQGKPVAVVPAGTCLVYAPSSGELLRLSKDGLEDLMKPVRSGNG